MPEPLPISVPVLSEAERWKQDRADDALFYAEPRFVQHLDGAFRNRLTALYAERIPPDAVVLDLMASWVSHLPEQRLRQALSAPDRLQHQQALAAFRALQDAGFAPSTPDTPSTP